MQQQQFFSKNQVFSLTGGCIPLNPQLVRLCVFQPLNQGQAELMSNHAILPATLSMKGNPDESDLTYKCGFENVSSLFSPA